MARSSSFSGASPPSAPPANVRATRLAFAEVVGDAASRGRPISAGPLLRTLDGFAASVAEKPMVMVAVERLDVAASVLHGDLVRFEGQLLHTGRSSVTVQITGHRRGLYERAFERALSAVMTLVAVDERGRPASSGVPTLVDSGDHTFTERMERWAADRKALSARWTQAQLEVDALPHVSRDMLRLAPDTGAGADGGEAVTVEESTVELATGFMPKQLNANGTVYGGELLLWMDNTAVFCAQSFARNEQVATVGVSRVAFLLPVTLQDFLTLSASVTHVSGSRMEVAVEVFLRTARSAEVKKSHAGYFTVANLDADGQEVTVRQQLSADADDERGLRALLKAQRRAELAGDEAALFALPPLDVSVGRATASKL